MARRPNINMWHIEKGVDDIVSINKQLSVYAKTSLSGTMECYHQSTAVDVYARHSQEGWSMNIIICACLAYTRLNFAETER